MEMVGGHFAEGKNCSLYCDGWFMPRKDSQVSNGGKQYIYAPIQHLGIKQQNKRAADAACH